jgi:hypothetical protein
MDEPPYTCETSEIMNKLDMGEIPETPAKEQGYGPLDAASCSELVAQAGIEAINGYLKNRYLLCEQLAEISSTYEREKDRRKCIENQIDIIDRCVIAVLHT